MILVTGGTGLVGAHLLYELSKAHRSIRAIKRDSSDIEKVKNVFAYYAETNEANMLFQKIEWCTADINNIPQLTEAFQGVNQVYHCAAHVSFDPSEEKKLRKVNIEGTANVVNLCISNQIDKLCHVSSIAAIGSKPNSNEVDETGKWNPEGKHNDYAISKYGAEIEVWRGTQEGVDAVIVNPGVIIGPGFWNSGSGKIFQKIDNGLNYHFPKVTGFVGVSDVVNSMISLMNSNIVNEQFIVISENISFKKVFDLAAETLDRNKPNRQLKKWMIALGWAFQKIGSLFGARQSITRESINGLFEKTFYDNSKIKSALKFDFKKMDSVIQETAEMYKKDKKR